jgi:HEAT repeat protein
MSGLAESLRDFTEKLGDADEAERIYAAEDIGYLNAADGVHALLKRLNNEPSRAVRDAIFQALIRIDADEAIEGSVGLLESGDPQIRNQAVDVLRHKGARSIPFLNAAMRDGDKDLRKLVLDVLTGIETGAAAEIYTAALSDKDLNVAITAVESLGKIRAVEFRSRIEDLLQADAHPMLTGACLEALGAMGNELSCAAIRGRFPDLAALPDFILVPCLKAIGAVGAARDFTDIAGLLAARRPQIRPAILGALIAIHQRYPVTAPGEDLLPALAAVIDDGDPPVCRYQAVRTLGFLASRDDVRTLLVSCLTSPERLVRLGAAESLRESERLEAKDALASRAIEETDGDVLQALIG